MKKKTIKWILGIIGVIFLGAVGSGLWQIGIEPVGNWILDVIFKVTTLGLSSLSDAFYQDVAKGIHEEPSLFALYLIVIGFLGFFGYIWGGISGERASKRINKKEDDIINKIKENKELSPDEKQVLIQEAKAKFYKKYQRSYGRSGLRLNIITIFLATFITFQYLTIARRNRVITKFRHAVTIGKPLLNEQEEEEILSKFSMIKNKKDYLNVLNTLQQKFEKIQKELEKEQQELEIKRLKAEKELEDSASSSDAKDGTK